jgi:hypothetical protein
MARQGSATNWSFSSTILADTLCLVKSVALFTEFRSSTSSTWRKKIMHFPGAPTISHLRRYNLLAGLLHAASAILVIAFANGFSLPVAANYMSGPPGTSKRQLVILGHVPMALLIVSFFSLSALAHLVIAGPKWSSYVDRLAKRQNPFRWIEYSLSSSIMVFAIAQLTGMEDVAALVTLVGVNASMIGFGWMQEKYEEPGSGLGPFWLGCGAGVIPWIAIGIYLVAPGASAHAPGFVYAIYVSLFTFFNCFAAVQFLQYKQIGKFKDYLYGERAYVTLSFVAKSLLAWQIFASTLVGSGH